MKIVSAMNDGCMLSGFALLYPTYLAQVPPDFPEWFGCIEDSRSHCQDFFPWYNKEHRHSGIGLLTPETMHYGLAQDVRKAREEVLRIAYETHPERFVRKIPVPPVIPEAAWINKPKPATESELVLH